MVTLKSWASNNTVELGYLMILLHSDYSFLSDEDQRVLIWMTLTKEGWIDLTILENLFKKYSQNKSSPTLSGTF